MSNGPGTDIAPTLGVTASVRPRRAVYISRYERDLLHRVVGMAHPGRARRHLRIPHRVRILRSLRRSWTSTRPRPRVYRHAPSSAHLQDERSSAPMRVSKNCMYKPMSNNNHRAIRIRLCTIDDLPTLQEAMRNCCAKRVCSRSQPSPLDRYQMRDVDPRG